MHKVLIVEDEPNMVVGLKDNFKFEGYDVFVATNGKDGIESAFSVHPDIIILDIMLPEMNGLEVCRQLRQRGLEIPIIMLTARGQETDKVMGLEIGADDYITKPFSIAELLARVRAHLRRAMKQLIEFENYKFGEVEIDFKKHTAFKAGLPIILSPREFEILKFFIRHKGEIVTREQLLDKVWGYDNFPFSRTVDSHIAKLRQKIEQTPTEPLHIITVHRIGYKFLD